MAKKTCPECKGRKTCQRCKGRKKINPGILFPGTSVPCTHCSKWGKPTGKCPKCDGKGWAATGGLF